MGVAVLSGGIITWFGRRMQSSEINEISKHMTISVKNRNKMYYYFVPKLSLFKTSITLNLRINGLKCLSKARQWPKKLCILVHIRILISIIYIQIKGLFLPTGVRVVKV